MRKFGQLLDIVAIGIGGVACIRGLVAGGFGITQAGFLSLFVATLCGLYAQLFVLIGRKKEMYRMTYTFLSRVFTFAAVISYVFLQSFLMEDGMGQYVLFRSMDTMVQKWIVGLILFLLGAVTAFLALINFKAEKGYKNGAESISGRK